MKKYKRTDLTTQMNNMGYDPYPYESPVEESTSPKHEDKRADDPPSISPKYIFLIAGLLIGIAAGYVITQSLIGDDESIPVASEILDESNNDELTKLRNELQNTQSEILILQGQLESFDETRDLLSTTNRNLDAANEQLLDNTNKINADAKTIIDLQNELEDVKVDLIEAGQQIDALLNAQAEAPAPMEPPPAAPMEPPPAPDPEPPAPDPEPAPEVEIDEKILLGDINLVYGTSLIPISEPTPIGESINIETNLTNITEESITFSWLATITDVNTGELIVELFAFNLVINSDASMSPSNSWTPIYSGQFRIDVVLVDNLVDRNPLSITKSTVITVS